jgi:transposase-like protein
MTCQERDGGRRLSYDLRPGLARRDRRPVGSRRHNLTGRFDKAAALVVRAKEEEVLAFRVFTRSHWRQIWSTNPLERLNKELKRQEPGSWHLPERGGRRPPGRRRDCGHP